MSQISEAREAVVLKVLRRSRAHLEAVQVVSRCRLDDFKAQVHRLRHTAVPPTAAPRKREP